MSILPVYSGENTREQNGCHAPLISDYSSVSKCLLVCECDGALKRYRSLLQLPEFALVLHVSNVWYCIQRNMNICEVLLFVKSAYTLLTCSLMDMPRCKMSPSETFPTACYKM